MTHRQCVEHLGPYLTCGMDASTRQTPSAEPTARTQSAYLGPYCEQKNTGHK